MDRVEKPISREEYIQKVLSAYRQTPGTAGTIRQPDRLLAAQLQQRGSSFVLPDLRRWARFVPWPTFRQS